MFSPPFVGTEVPVERKRDFAPLPVRCHCAGPSADIGGVVEYQGVRSFNVQCDGIVPLTVIRRADLYQVIAKHIHIVTTNGESFLSLRLRAGTGSACAVRSADLQL